MELKIAAPRAVHYAFKADFDAFLRRWDDKVSNQEMLAVLAQILGMVIAYQDQRELTPAEAMEVVARNIEAGNQMAIDRMGAPQGTA